MKRELMAGSFVLLALLLLITVGGELVLAQAGSISGHVYLEDGVTPVQGSCFWVQPGEPGSAESWPYCLTAADGSFEIPGLSSGTYYLSTDANDQGWNPLLIDEWYTPEGGTQDLALAAPIEVVEGSTTPGITFTLKVAGAISGHVYLEDGVTPVQGSCFRVHPGEPGSAEAWPYCLSEPDGAFTIPGLYSGTYYLSTDANDQGWNPLLINEWYTPEGGTPDPALAAPIEVVTGSITSGITFTLKVAGAITGHVYLEDRVTPVEGSCFHIAPDDPLSEDGWPYCLSGSEGEFTISGLYSGTYYLCTWANGLGMNPSLLDEWYTPEGGTPDPALAAPIEVVTGSATSGITFTLASECVVANTADSGLNTLRQCLELAEAGDTITFDPGVFPPGSPATITLVSDLPALLVGNVTIDGSGAGVIVEGSGFHIWSDGNRIQGLQIYNAWTGIEVGGGGSYNVITGNVLSGHGWAGVDLHDAGTMFNTVSGNLIGTDASGTVAVGNGGGVKIREGAEYNLIGGDTPAERNVISASRGENISDGVALDASSYNTVIGNYIGTDIHGTTALPNLETGVDLCCGASHNTIGGTTAGERNIISGSGAAVRVRNAGTDDNVIRGNYIGTDATGTVALPNQTGVSLWQGARHNVVGGTSPGEGNLISGNTGSGVVIWSAETLSNTVVGNLIGTDPTGMAALGNGSGIVFEEAAYNIIGGDTPAERNVISGNGGGGLSFYFGAHHNTISGNYIGTDIAGTAALPNQGYGVGVNGGSNHNLIGGDNGTPGGDCTGACNLISGNQDGGVIINTGGTLSNTVSGNYIGTDVAGTAPIPNGGAGVTIKLGAAQNLIGGDTAAQRNLITYNGGDGVELLDWDTNQNRIQGNWIGVDVDGSRDVAVSLVAYSPAYATDETLFLGTDGQGIWKSTDGGAHWTAVNSGLADLDVDALAISPDYGADGTLFAGTEAGVFKSIDGGASWVDVSPEEGGGSVRSIALSPDYGDDQTVLVGNGLYWSDLEDTWIGGVWRSADGGATWDNLAPAAGTGVAHSPVLAEMEDPQVLEERGLVLPGLEARRWFTLGEGDMMRSLQDEGRIVAYAVAFSPDYASDGTIFVGGYGGDFYRSTDGGETWSVANSGLDGTNVWLIAVSPGYGDDGTLFVMDTNQEGTRPFRSTDGGTSWEELATGLPDDHSMPRGLAISPEFGDDDTVFVAFGYANVGVRGVFRSTDRGNTWLETEPGLSGQSLTGMLVTSPGDVVDAELLMAAGRNGLLRSTDAGDGWAFANGDLCDPPGGGNGVGIYAAASDNTVEGNLISNNAYNGIRIQHSDTSGNLISGNYIGTDASGTMTLGNTANGVEVSSGSHHNLIGSSHASPGGACSGDCNLISGNGLDGIFIYDWDTEGNSIRGNHIGTDLEGLSALGNYRNGVQISGGAGGNTVGGGMEAHRNLISGNGENGIAIVYYSEGNTVSGNYVGTDASGTDLVPNGYIGVIVASCAHNVIGGLNASPGGDCTGECNLVSGNDYGVEMFYATNITVTGNYIGTDVSGTAWLSSNVVQVGGAYNRIGGTNPGERNVLAGPLWIAPPYEGPHHHQIIGNHVGVDATGTTCIGQGWGGIGVGGSDHVVGGDTPAEGNLVCGFDHWGISVSGSDNVVGHNRVYGGGDDGISVIGSDNLLAHNEIHDNYGDGVGVNGPAALRNTITEGSIYSNGSLGIHLVDGGNTELPAPVILVYDTAAGIASGTACPLCTVEVLSDEDEEGRWYEGTVVADALGHWSFDKGAPFTGPNVHATATDADGNTSEFSGPLHDIAVVGAAPGGEVAIGEPSGVFAELRNEGSQPETNVPVRCSIENAGYDETQTSGEIPPATWAMVAFPDWVPTAGGVFTLTCESLLGDENPANDRFTQPVTVTVPGGPDVWTKDNWEDTGDVPSEQPWWVSPDLWVRHQPDGGLVHENPIAFEENTVYVRIRNRGGSPASGVVQVFWERSRIGWPCKVGEPNVGTLPFEDLAPGEVRILSLPWTPEEPGEHGLHTVIEAEGDPANSSAPCSPHRPRWDNNVSWHNVIAYFHPLQAGRRPLSLEEVDVDVVNIYDWPKDTDLVFERGTFPATSTIHLQLDEALFDRWWSYAGRWQEGVAVDEATKRITVTGEVSATLGALPLAAGEQVTATLTFAAPDEGAFDVRLYERVDGGVVGGISYRWLERDPVPPEVVSTSPPHGAVDVALDAPLVITFTEPIGPLSLSLAVTPDPGGWHLAWNASGTVLTATHSGLALTTTYAVNVTAGDAFGNAMPAPYAWTFSTGKQAYWMTYLPLVVRND